MALPRFYAPLELLYSIHTSSCPTVCILSTCTNCAFVIST